MDTVNDKTRSAKQQLIDAGWCVGIGRDIIEAHAKSDFGALIAFAAITAWKDRGPACDIDGERSSARTPPGGWAGMVGTTPPTWRAWRDKALEVGLISKGHGFYESGPPVDVLTPTPAYRTEEQEQGYAVATEQFSRVPCAVLFDKEIGRGAKRVLVGLALFRNAKGFATVAVQTIAEVAALNVRNTQLGLRRLELAGVIKSNGLNRRARTYEIIEQSTDRVAMSDTPGGKPATPRVKASDTPGGKPATPRVKASDTPGGKPATPRVKASDTLSSKATGKPYQENQTRKDCQANRSGAEGRRHPQKELVLMRVIEGRKDVRQESEAVTEPAPTPEYRRERIAILDEALSSMSRLKPGYSVLAEGRDEHLAALATDTELRKSA